MVSIHLLGQPEILHDGVPLAVSRRKSRALLFYLAARRAPATREQVIELLWPDLPRAAAQQTLRVTLYGLRKALGPQIIADDSALAVADADVDTWQLDDALAAPPGDAATLERALGRYRGDFLDGFSLPDSPEFDDWVATRREHYRRAAVHGLVLLAQIYEAQGAYREAVRALERALALEPLQEDVQREAMRLQYLAGDRVGAIRRYEDLKRRLDDELGVLPMAETRTIYDAIIKDEGRMLYTEGVPFGNAERRMAETLLNNIGALQPPPLRFHRAGDAKLVQRSAFSVQPSDLPFTGRAVELQALSGATAAGQLALVEGEPGIGKTRLVEEFLRGLGGLALAGTARELDQALPYQPVVEALRGLVERPEWPELRARLGLSPLWAAEVGRLLPELGPAGAPPAAGAADESRVREGVSQLLRALARLRPLSLFIDDLQWADAATLGLLGYLVRQQIAGVVLIGAARPAEPRSPLATLAQALTREGRLGRIRLARLSAEDTRALARHVSPGAAEQLAAWLARNSEGNPYMLVELVRHARASGILRPDGTLQATALDDESPVVPPTIYTLIAARLARLSEPARRVLDAAVAVGREFTFDVVARAAALSDEAALDALDALIALGLVRPAGGERYVFEHSLTMEVAYQEVGEARHRLIHRRVAEALEEVHRRRLDEVAGLIAMHFVEGGAPERAAAYALRAGRHAASLAAWTEAIGFYRQALTGAGEEERLAVLLALADVQLQGGASAQAAEVYREAVALAGARRDEAGASAARLGLAEALLLQGRFAEVIAIARQALAAGDAALAVQAELLWGTALSLEGADLAGAAEHLRRAEALALGPGGEA
ncbi:MAG TPA: AAA family ATPase, partial [Roseiflexaceae bacterium]|nr:AAA family ATPase [Roseiflexaceae bacterium]